MIRCDFSPRTSRYLAMAFIFILLGMSQVQAQRPAEQVQPYSKGACFDLVK